MKFPSRIKYFGFAVVLLFLVSCTVDIQQTQPATPVRGSTETATVPAPTETPTPTGLPPTETFAVETSSAPDQPADETATPTTAPSEPTVTPTIALPPAIDGIADPFPWAGEDLTGRLITIMFNNGQQSVVAFDFATGGLHMVFEPPPNIWLTGASVSPDGQQIVIAYSPPPPEGEFQYGYTGLYTIPFDGSSEPQVLLATSEPQEAFLTPIWSPDGAYVYYAHFRSTPDGEDLFIYTVERISVSDLETELLIEKAFWPRLSPDGSLLAYVSFDPNLETNELVIANPDGSGTRTALDVTIFNTVDAPLFSTDNEWLYFSAPTETGASLNWLDRVLGVQLASAHAVPSDWFRVPVAGGEPQRITQIFDQGMFGDIAQNGEKIAFISTTGIHIMNQDGSEITQIFPSGFLFGSMEWVP